MSQVEEVAFRREFGPSTTEPSVALVEALADAEDVSPTERFGDEGKTLSDYVDPDALDRLLAHDDQDLATVSFIVEDYVVYMMSTGVVPVREDRSG